MRIALLRVGAVTGASAVFIVSCFALAWTSGVSVASLTRDANQSAGLAWYVGSLSWFGVLIWASSSLLAVAASLRATSRAQAQLLRSFGLLGLVLALDDGFMLHESAIPRLVGTSEVEYLIFAGYGLAALFIATRFWRLFTPTALAFAVVAMAGLGASVVDDALGLTPAFVEDGFKLVGIVAWAGVAIAQAGKAVPFQDGSPRGSGQP